MNWIFHVIFAILVVSPALCASKDCVEHNTGFGNRCWIMSKDYHFNAYQCSLSCETSGSRCMAWAYNSRTKVCLLTSDYNPHTEDNMEYMMGRKHCNPDTDDELYGKIKLDYDYEYCKKYKNIRKYIPEAFDDFSTWRIYNGGESPSYRNLWIYRTSREVGLKPKVTNDRYKYKMISSDAYGNSLIIMKTKKFPTGCGVETVFRTMAVAPNHNGGEITMVRRRNNDEYMYSGVTTADGCHMNNVDESRFSGNWVMNADGYESRECHRTSKQDGCFVEDDSWIVKAGYQESYVAMEIDRKRFVRIWHFNENDAPSDIQSNNPTPDKWFPVKKPTVWFSLSDRQNGDYDNCKGKKYFQKFHIVLEMSLCTDFVTKDTSTCPDYIKAKSACKRHLKNDRGTDNEWLIDYIKVFKREKCDVEALKDSKPRLRSGDRRANCSTDEERKFEKNKENVLNDFGGTMPDDCLIANKSFSNWGARTTKHSIQNFNACHKACQGSHDAWTWIGREKKCYCFQRIYSMTKEKASERVISGLSDCCMRDQY